MAANRLRDLYEWLHSAYGPQDWWPAGDRFEVIVGAILTQRTTWHNAEQAIRRLRASRLLAIDALHGAASTRIAEAIRPAGFHREKTKKLKAFATHAIERHGGELDRLFAMETAELRDELLGIYGIGEETADAILVYVANRPSFVIDTYTVRLLTRLGWIEGRESYGMLREMFLEALPVDVAVLGEAHALIVRHGKEHCRSAPICDGCPIRSHCDEGRATAAEVSR